MAAKKSTPGPRSRRNRPPSPMVPASECEALHAHIEEERDRLMDAETVLDCVVIALEDDERMDKPGPYYAKAIRIARQLVRTSINQLDSIKIKAAMKQVQTCAGGLAEGEGSETRALRQYDDVKESPAPYVH